MLAHWNNSPLIDMSPQSNQSLLFLLNEACLAEKQQIPILKFLVLPEQGSNLQIYRTHDQHANHYTTDTILIMFMNCGILWHTLKFREFIN